MGEFQCYKFKTIDRALTDSERREVDGLSSRGHVTSTSATFIYHYSDFRHDEEKVLEKYFDAMLYFANWGTRRLMFRLPAKLVDAEALWKYCYDDEWGEGEIKLKRRGEYYLLDLHYNEDEGGGWMEDDDFEIGDLAPLRDEILRGDYRALYLLWAKFSQNNASSEDFDDEDFGDMDDDENEGPTPPPVPPNMKKLNSAHTALARFFDIDEDLVAAAKTASPDAAAIELDYEKLLRQLPDNEQFEWLARLLKGELQLDILLKKRLEKIAPEMAKPDLPTVSPAQLRSQQKVQEDLRQKREAAAAKAAHEKKMRELAGQEEALWKSVTHNILRQSGKSYDLATDTLKDLKDLAQFQGRQAAFRETMLELRKEFSRRSTLIGRWEKAGLFK